MSATGLGCSVEFQPTLPMRGATAPYVPRREGILIPTHAPHAGSDINNTDHALTVTVFQPTLPMRGATEIVEQIVSSLPIPTHAPHAGSDLR